MSNEKELVILLINALLQGKLIYICTGFVFKIGIAHLMIVGM